MNKDFLVFGCSLSYGHELKDTPHNDVLAGVIKPSKFSWPALLGALNYSVPGSSNDRIKRNCIHTTSTLRPKLVGISWSYPERQELPDFTTDKENPEGDYFTNMGHWIQGRKNKFDIRNWIKPDVKIRNSDLWYKFVDIYYKMVYSDVYGMYRFLDNVYMTQLHLESLDTEYFMVVPSHKTLQLNTGAGNLITGNPNKIPSTPSRYIFDYQDDTINMDKIIGSVVRTRKLIDWSKFIFIENDISKYNGIMDIGKKLNDIGKAGHPLEKSHKHYANYLKDVTI